MQAADIEEAEEPRHEAATNTGQEEAEGAHQREAGATQKPPTDLRHEDTSPDDIEAAGQEADMPLKPEAAKPAWQEAGPDKNEAATCAVPIELDSGHEDARLSDLEATNNTGQEDEVPHEPETAENATPCDQEAAINMGQETDMPLEPTAAENATHEAATDLEQEDATPDDLEATANMELKGVGQEADTPQKAEATEKKTQPRVS